MNQNFFRPLRSTLLVLALLTLLLLAVAPALAGQEAPQAVSADLEQCANGSDGSNDTCDPSSGNIGWITGQIGSSKARYGWGSFVPYRMVFDNLSGGQTYCFAMTWDVTESARPAIDYIGTFDETIENADPLLDTALAGVPVSSAAIAIGPDPAYHLGVIDGVNASTSPPLGHPQLPGDLTFWNALPADISDDAGDNVLNYYANEGIYGSDPNAVCAGVSGQPVDLTDNNCKQQSLEFCFTVDGQGLQTAVAAWSGHISYPPHWGTDALPNGSSYHMRTGSVTVTRTGYSGPSVRTNDNRLSCVTCGDNGVRDDSQNIGSQDVQLSASAVQIPTAVTLADFSAACVGATPVISWETVSELTNQGFNLYRSLDVNDPNPTQLNSTLIPSQGPGSAQGFMYTWTDETAAPDSEYLYWLEDVDFAGATAMHGPISVMCSAPTAVTFSNLDAGGTATSVFSGWMVALLLGVMLAGFVAVRRMRTN